MNLKETLCLSMFAGISILWIAAEPAPSALPRSTPEKQGISSAAILDFVEAAGRKIDAMHSFMLVRHGKVVAEGWWSPYGAQISHSMFSLSKSFTSTAVGLAIAEGKLSLDDPVLKFFPEDAPANPSVNLQAMRVRDLLIMSTGQLSNEVAKIQLDLPGQWTKEFLALPVEHKPGTFWFYNTPASYMLSAIVQKVTGTTVLDYLQPRIFEPLGIENPAWDTSSQGISLGGYGLSIRTEDIARFGLLYLNKGNWHGKQLVPAAWVAAATARQTSNGSNPDSDWEQGYGYQFWITRHGLYRGDGAFGQFCIVMPEQDAIVVMTAGTTNTASMMNLVWDKLLAAMQPKPLRADPKTLNKLKDTLVGLTLHPQQGSTSPGFAAQISDRRYLFPANDQKIESVALEFGRSNSPVTLVIRCNGTEQRVNCGYGDWVKGRMTYASDILRQPVEQPVAASGAWIADGIYKAKLAFYETPFCVAITLQFSGNLLLYDTKYNVVRRGFTKLPQLVGHME
jgi:CubicO group peptidase (beta-lactamase class C family)